MLAPIAINAQDLPAEMYFSPDGRMLHTGGQPSTGFYEKEIIRTIDLYFTQSNLWTLLTQNYTPQIDLAATMSVDGITYDSVGVRFKGQTSYSMLPPGSQKRSFNITMDHAIEDQNVMGYETLNLNNAFQDASFLREVVFLDLIRDHVPAAKGNFVHLNINDEDWGLYPNIQQLNSQFLKEWFFSNSGTLWRADAPGETPGGGGPGGGPNWGDGTAALNYLGNDTAEYQQYYTLKRTEQTDPWDALVTTCHRLNTMPAEMIEDSLPHYLDIDRVLWFLASEIAFSDDDSYVHKGKMDYYLYWDEETGRMTPLEFDGNSVMKNNAVTWSPFYNADDVNYPLLNKLLAVPAYRQRHLAHLRTIISEKIQGPAFNALLASYSTLIDAEVAADPKKLYTYTAFQNELTTLQNYITNRRNFLNSDPEVAQSAPGISSVVASVNGIDWAQPLATESVDVSCNVSSSNGIFSVMLYYSQGLYGNFNKLEMFDDGAHNDGANGDGIFGARLPAAAAAMTYVRWYVEATSDNTAKSVSFYPPGAEHDIHIYQVSHELMADAPVRINELMALNTSTIADGAFEYDDWIELFNVSDEAYDLSGHWLTDNGIDLQKYQFPEGTIIQPGEYLMIWADSDIDQSADHAGFSLNSDGEELWLSNAQSVVLDHVVFDEQTADLGLARVPNGTGPFVIQSPTYAMSNEFNVGITASAAAIDLSIFPNPANQLLTLVSHDQLNVSIQDATGRQLWSGQING
ncbi:MAG: CotH kinase family protein, partial [Bacteroidota bacterium]|nr:CotH kinase family protein [Bacteroidota bacterium]